MIAWGRGWLWRPCPCPCPCPALVPPAHTRRPSPACPTSTRRQLNLQADRQGRSVDFAAAFAGSELKAAADKELEQLLVEAEEMGERVAGRAGFAAGRQRWGAPGGQGRPAGGQAAAVPPPTHPPTHTSTHAPPPPADEATEKDMAVKRETVTPFWWALKTLFKVGVEEALSARAGPAAAGPPHPSRAAAAARWSALHGHALSSSSLHVGTAMRYHSVFCSTVPPRTTGPLTTWAHASPTSSSFREQGCPLLPVCLLLACGLLPACSPHACGLLAPALARQAAAACRPLAALRAGPLMHA